MAAAYETGGKLINRALQDARAELGRRKKIDLFKIDIHKIERLSIKGASPWTSRRRAFLMMLGIAGTSTREPVKAQQGFDFDPVTTAKLRAGEIAREISESRRDTSLAEASRDTVFNTGLLLQAGLRALLPIQERQGVALPGAPSPKDPLELVEAQENYKAVFTSGAEAAAAQKMAALKAIKLAAQQLGNEGYKTFSKAVSDWVASATSR